GARENRLEVADNSMSSLVSNQEERMSNIEDVDIAELMTKLESQRIAYQAVMQSTSKIMQMNLMNFI
ncbi:MAG: flagellin, partial [Thermodesulfobacteriota bacterium]